METKKCFKCKFDKCITDFNKNKAKKDGLQSRCKICDRKRAKSLYNDNTREVSKIRNTVRRKNIRKWFIEYKNKLCCIKCGESRWYVLDFHHRDEKETEIGDALMRGWSIKRIKKEIEKCDPLCANCHRELHYLESIE
jgi:hypothetical protein